MVYGDLQGLWGLVALQPSMFTFDSDCWRIELDLSYDIRKAGFKRLQELSFSYYDKTSVGWLMARMTSDVEIRCHHCMELGGYGLGATAMIGAWQPCYI